MRRQQPAQREHQSQQRCSAHLHKYNPEQKRNEVIVIDLHAYLTPTTHPPTEPWNFVEHYRNAEGVWYIWFFRILVHMFENAWFKNV